MDIVLQTHALSKLYGGRPAVNALNLTVRRGDVYGFVGPNGAGKTTTMRMIAGLVRPSAGRVELLGRDLTRAPRSLMDRLGCLIEGPAFYGHLSAAENLGLVQTLKRSRHPREVSELLDLVQLSGTGAKLVREFSLGMRQRLGVAMALVGRPELVILDEPSNGLDPAGMRDMRDLLQRLTRELGVTILLSSHLLHEVQQVASRIGVIRGGRLQVEAPVEELRQMGRGGIEVGVTQPAAARQLLTERLGAQVTPAPDGHRETLPPVTVDPALLRRAVGNLLVNALRHARGATRVRVQLQRSGAQAVITVADNGAGIDPAVLPRLFDRYYRGTSATAGERGTGLGLAIVKQVALAHGGNVGATSTAGQGTSFQIRLPL